MVQVEQDQLLEQHQATRGLPAREEIFDPGRRAVVPGALEAVAHRIHPLGQL
jgi:hypothetical protein